MKRACAYFSPWDTSLSKKMLVSVKLNQGFSFFDGELSHGEKSQSRNGKFNNPAANRPRSDIVRPRQLSLPKIKKKYRLAEFHYICTSRQYCNLAVFYYKILKKGNGVPQFDFVTVIADLIPGAIFQDFVPCGVCFFSTEAFSMGLPLPPFLTAVAALKQKK